MSITLAFDIYGTLIDTQGIVEALQPCVGEEQAGEFAALWRAKQLEYAYRRGLMQDYCDFAECTRQALEYTCLYYKMALSEQEKRNLMEAYRNLPAFPDVQGGLELAKQAGFRLFAFSNGKAEAVEHLLNQAGIRQYFMDVVSVDDLKTFKPNPSVYKHFLQKADVANNSEEAWLVSSNPFDVIGAIHAGMQAAWLRRSPDVIFDPWELQPTLTVTNLLDLVERIRSEREPSVP